MHYNSRPHFAKTNHQSITNDLHKKKILKHKKKKTSYHQYTNIQNHTLHKTTKTHHLNIT